MRFNFLRIDRKWSIWDRAIVALIFGALFFGPAAALLYTIFF